MVPSSISSYELDIVPMVNLGEIVKEKDVGKNNFPYPSPNSLYTWVKHHFTHHTSLHSLLDPFGLYNTNYFRKHFSKLKAISLQYQFTYKNLSWQNIIGDITDIDPITNFLFYSTQKWRTQLAFVGWLGCSPILNILCDRIFSIGVDLKMYNI